MDTNRRAFAVAALAAALIGPLQAQPSVQVATEYLMTITAPLDAGTAIDGSLLIVPVRAGGSVKGPKINGQLVPPGGDWLRILPAGVARLDVRGTIKTDDNALVFVSYNGIIQQSKESADRLNKGELVTSKDMPYFVTAPTFQTSSEKYGWLNAVQAVGKMVEVKLGADGYVKYDVFAVK